MLNYYLYLLIYLSYYIIYINALNMVVLFFFSEASRSQLLPHSLSMIIYQYIYFYFYKTQKCECKFANSIYTGPGPLGLVS